MRGCSLVSEGCRNCYAMKQAHRFSGPGQKYDGLTKTTSQGPTWTGTARFVPEMVRRPLEWSGRHRVFVNSMSDLFHDDVTDNEIAEVFGVMAVCGAGDTSAPTKYAQFGGKYEQGKGWVNQRGPHTFIVLTKRPKRMCDLLNSAKFRSSVAGHAYKHAYNQRDAGYLADCISAIESYTAPGRNGRSWPLSNVWLGVSAEDQATFDERVAFLLRTPAAVRCVSMEPMLGPIDAAHALLGHCSRPGCRGRAYMLGQDRCEEPYQFTCGAPINRLDWVILGGESGAKARSCDVGWIRNVVEQCDGSCTAVFVKQLGAESTWNDDDDMPQGSLLHTKGGDPMEWPVDLRVRSFPGAPVECRECGMWFDDGDTCAKCAIEREGLYHG